MTERRKIISSHRRVGTNTGCITGHATVFDIGTRSATLIVSRAGGGVSDAQADAPRKAASTEATRVADADGGNGGGVVVLVVVGEVDEGAVARGAVAGGSVTAGGGPSAGAGDGCSPATFMKRCTVYRALPTHTTPTPTRVNSESMMLA